MVCSVAWAAGQAVSSIGLSKIVVSNMPLANALSVLPLVLLTLGAMVAVAALHALQRERYGLKGALSSLVAFIGLAMFFVIMTVNALLIVLDASPPLLDYLSPFLYLGGPALATIGIIALGAVTRVAEVLPWWCAVALLAGSPLGLFVLWAFGLFVLGGLLELLLAKAPNLPLTITWAVPWIVVGYAVFRAAGRRIEHPARVR